jgi:hypothetical protein
VGKKGNTLENEKILALPLLVYSADFCFHVVVNCYTKQFQIFASLSLQKAKVLWRKFSLVSKAENSKLFLGFLWL